MAPELHNRHPARAVAPMPSHNVWRFMKILNARVHGYLDFVVVALFLAAPSMFGFGGRPQIACYVVAAVHLALSLVTAYPFGLLKLVPFPAHGVVELLVIPSLAALPWVLGFSEVLAARNFFLASAGLVAVVVVLTNYKAADAKASARPSFA